jgi:PEGA domain
MAYRLRLVGAIAVALISSSVFVQGQSVASGSASVLPQRFGYESPAAYQNGGSAGHYVYAPTPKPQDSGQQQSDSSEGQSQSGNQDQGMKNGQNQTQGQNQNQVENGQGKNKEEAPPKKPTYLTYSVQKKSLEEQAKSGKTLSVDFKSVPAGASITVDGYFVGRTPSTKQIPVGKHLVSITKWGYETWSQELDVSSLKNLSINPSLHKDW